MSLLPDTPPEPDSLHEYALDYRTAQMYGETAAAWVRLEAFVGRKIEDAIRVERERCAQIAEGNYEAKTFGLSPSSSQAGQIAAAIRRG